MNHLEPAVFLQYLATFFLYFLVLSKQVTFIWKYKFKFKTLYNSSVNLLYNPVHTYFLASAYYKLLKEDFE